MKLMKYLVESKVQADEEVILASRKLEELRVKLAEEKKACEKTALIERYRAIEHMQGCMSSRRCLLVW